MRVIAGIVSFVLTLGIYLALVAGGLVALANLMIWALNRLPNHSSTSVDYISWMYVDIAVLAAVLIYALMVLLMQVAHLYGYECSICHASLTFRVNEQGYRVCAECNIKLRMTIEPKRNCTVDGTLMLKENIENELIIDRCPVCQGVWLDGGEIEHLRDLVEDEAYARGHSAGIGSGLAIGIATGISVS